MNNNHPTITFLSQLHTVDKAAVDTNCQATDLTSIPLHRHHIYSNHKQDQTKIENQEKKSTPTHTPKNKLELKMEEEKHRIDFGLSWK
jgi:hypothetical protein